MNLGETTVANELLVAVAIVVALMFFLAGWRSRGPW